MDPDILPPGDIAEPSRQGRPICSRHLVQMTAYSTKANKTYYRCQVDGCPEKEVAVRPNSVVPEKPTICPRCDVACEVDKEFRSRFLWQLRCPCGCGFVVRIAKFTDAPKMTRVIPTDTLDI